MGHATPAAFDGRPARPPTGHATGPEHRLPHPSHFGHPQGVDVVIIQALLRIEGRVAVDGAEAVVAQTIHPADHAVAIVLIEHSPLVRRRAETAGHEPLIRGQVAGKICARAGIRDAKRAKIDGRNESQQEQPDRTSAGGQRHPGGRANDQQDSEAEKPVPLKIVRPFRGIPDGQPQRDRGRQPRQHQVPPGHFPTAAHETDQVGEGDGRQNGHAELRDAQDAPRRTKAAHARQHQLQIIQLSAEAQRERAANRRQQHGPEGQLADRLRTRRAILCPRIAGIRELRLRRQGQSGGP